MLISKMAHEKFHELQTRKQLESVVVCLSACSNNVSIDCYGYSARGLVIHHHGR